ncbi:MAG: hypothetical protein PHS57_02135 [Alphaproteobacteria bacterium]|nr:hypothetical protein [Alphaproteobacteria bacterium]
MDTRKDNKGKDALSREERMAAALRNNLRKRKAQTLSWKKVRQETKVK